VRAGTSRHGFHPHLIDHHGDPMRVAMDRVMDEELEGEERMFILAEWALGEACETVHPLLDRAAVFLGLPESRPGWTAAAAEPFTRALLAQVAPQVHPSRVYSFAAGHAAGLLAMARAVEALQAGDCELAIVGGVDSYIHIDTLEWLDEQGRLHNDLDSRSSFVPGEAAGFCVLASPSWCRGRRVTPLARIVGLGLATEQSHIGTETICVGEGLSQAIRDATRGLRLPEQKIGDTYCDLNGERYRSEEFAFAALRNPQPFVDVNRFTAPADSWGDVGAASGPLFAMLATASGLRAYSRTHYVLAFASSDGGLRGAVALAVRQSSQSPSA
jgi:3-oxoacyl-[acyl-carrier-protein] synthase-1